MSNFLFAILLPPKFLHNFISFQLDIKLISHNLLTKNGLTLHGKVYTVQDVRVMLFWKKSDFKKAAEYIVHVILNIQTQFYEGLKLKIKCTPDELFKFRKLSDYN